MHKSPRTVILIFALVLIMIALSSSAFADAENIVISVPDCAILTITGGADINPVGGYTAETDMPVSFTVSVRPEYSSQGYSITEVKAYDSFRTLVPCTEAAGVYAFSMPAGGVTIEVSVDQPYNVYVAGVRVTASNKDNVIETLPGQVRYDSSSNTIYLSNASIVYSGDSGISFTGGSAAAVVFSGSCSIVPQPGGQSSLTAISSGGPLRLEAAYSASMLSLDGSGSSGSGFGINTNGNSLSISADSYVTSIGGGSGSSTGVSAGSVNVYGSLTATAYSSAGSSTGIICSSLSALSMNTVKGSVSATAGDAPNSIGIQCSGAVVTEYGTSISASSGTAVNTSSGISCSSLTNNGTVSALAGKGVTVSQGIYAGTVVTGGARLKADSYGSDSGSAFGICADSISANGSLVEASARSAAVSLGIKAALTVSGSCVVDSYGVTRALDSEPLFAGGYYPAAQGSLTEEILTPLAAPVSWLSYRHLYIQPGTAPTPSPSPSPSPSPEPQRISGIYFTSDNPLYISGRGAVKTLYYIVYPLTGADRSKVEWSYMESATGIVSVSADPVSQKLSICALGSGTVFLTGKSTDGGNVTSETLKIVLSDVDYRFSYKQNDGVWFYDSPYSFTLQCTGPASEFSHVLIDGNAYYPNSGYYSVSGSSDTTVTFTQNFMTSLAHGRHSFTFVYRNGKSVSTYVYSQSRLDPPKTGDDGRLCLFAALFIVSGSVPAICIVKRRKRNGI